MRKELVIQLTRLKGNFENIGWSCNDRRQRSGRKIALRDRWYAELRQQESRPVQLFLSRTPSAPSPNRCTSLQGPMRSPDSSGFSRANCASSSSHGFGGCAEKSARGFETMAQPRFNSAGDTPIPRCGNFFQIRTYCAAAIRTSKTPVSTRAPMRTCTQSR